MKINIFSIWFENHYFLKTAFVLRVDQLCLYTIFLKYIKITEEKQTKTNICMWYIILKIEVNVSRLLLVRII